MLLLTLVVGSSALVFTALLIRSEKQRELDLLLDVSGDYDEIIYNATEEDYSLLKNSDIVSAVGEYVSSGYVGLPESDNKYRAAFFSDDASREIYHLSCIYGEYPQNDNEIAIDIRTAKLCGIEPKIGEHIKLNIYSEDKTKKSEAEFVICGLFEASSEESEMHWIRYPSVKVDEDYCLPAFFVNRNMSENDLLGECEHVIFFQKEDSCTAEALKELHSNLSQDALTENHDPIGRKTAYAEVLGVLEKLFLQDGTLTQDEINESVRDGSAVKDFYSSVFMPVLAVITFVIVLITSNGCIKEIVNDRRVNSGILISLGLSRVKCEIMLLAELMIFLLISCVAGFFIGSGLQNIAVYILNQRFSTGLIHGSNVSPYINAVTHSPVKVLLIMLLALTVAFIPVLMRLKKEKIIDLLKEATPGNGRNHRSGLKTWRRTIHAATDLFDAGTFIIFVVLAGYSMLGFKYMNALVWMENNQYRYENEAAGLAEYDYLAQKDANITPYFLNAENRHYTGITKSAFDQLKKNPQVERSFSAITNLSTKIEIKTEKLTEEQITDLQPIQENPNLQNAKSDLDIANCEAQNAMLQAAGFDYSSNMIYSVPSIGLEEDSLDSLKNNLISGEISTERLNDGSDILVCCTQANLDIVKSLFSVGEELEFSDIVLNEQEEKLNFESIDPMEYLDVVYKKEITDPDGLSRVIASCKLGQKKNITTRIAGIVLLDTEKGTDSFWPPLISYGKNSSKWKNTGIYLLSGTEAFGKWGLPDVNYTSVKFKLKENADIESFDRDFYEAMSSCNRIQFSSSYEIKKKMESVYAQRLSIFYSFSIMLVLLCIVCSSIRLYGKLRIKLRTYAILQAVGMNRKQMCEDIIGQNVVYPVAGVLFSWVPVMMCQQFFDFIKNNVDSGKWISDGIVTEIPWYHYVPFRYDLFSENYIGITIILFVILLFITALSTLPQLVLMKRPINDSLKNNEY